MTDIPDRIVQAARKALNERPYREGPLVILDPEIALIIEAVDVTGRELEAENKRLNARIYELDTQLGEARGEISLLKKMLPTDGALAREILRRAQFMSPAELTAEIVRLNAEVERLKGQLAGLDIKHPRRAQAGGGE